MPIFPTATGAPYSTAQNILNRARQRLGDRLPTLASVSGKLLDSTQAFALQAFNSAWHVVQDKLRYVGCSQLKDETLITGLPVTGTTDPAIENTLGWQGYFDGVTLWPAFVLPSNMRVPLNVWERPTGISVPFPDRPNENMVDGLPSFVKAPLNCYWMWRAGLIRMPGALSSVDLRITFSTFFPDFADSGNTHWFDLNVPIIGIEEVMANALCEQVPAAKGKFAADLESSIAQFMADEIGQKQRVNIQRRARTYGRGRGYY